MMRIYATAIYLFLYLPIGIIALFSFSAGRSASQLQGFSTQWYSKALENPFVIDALKTSASVALTSAFISCLLGTMAAIALTGLKGKLRVLFDAMIYIAVMIPGIVIGIATLIALVTVFNTVNPWLQALTGLKLSLGYGSLIAAHVLFTMSLVIILVRARIDGMDRSLIEASSDLGAGPLATFRQVTLPMLMPAMMAGFLLSLTADDPADLHLLVHSSRGDTRDQCHRYNGDGVLSAAARLRTSHASTWKTGRALMTPFEASALPTHSAIILGKIL
jgi:spermidine/putrescine transport system permease protein